jgi:hypothetical protein
MRFARRVTEELREWAHRPTALSGEDAARAVTARLAGGMPSPRRSKSRLLLAVAAAACVAIVALYTTVRGHVGRAPAAGTTAAITLTSGTQLVIELKEVKR